MTSTPSLVPPLPAPEDLQPVHVGPGLRRAVAALVEASSAGEDLPEVDADDLARRVGIYLGAMPMSSRLAVRAAIALFDLSAVLRYGHRFSRLDADARVRWLSAWSDSRHPSLRLLVKLILTVLRPLHFARRPVQAAVGYPPDRLDRIEPARPVHLPPDRVVAIDRDRQVRCQVVVVGSGAGGAVIACELAERGLDVVLVEEGRFHDASELGHEPVRNLRETYRDAGATFALGRPGMPVPMGRTVGGTTTINSGTCFRLPAHVRDAWRARGLPIDDAELDRCYARVEKRISVREVPPALLGGSSAVIARGAEALGLDHGPLRRNIDGCAQSGVCAFGCPRNGKQSMNVTYVPWALEAGATLYTGVRARRILVERGRARGIVGRTRNGAQLTVHAEVVVSSCGTVPGVPFLAASGVRSRHLGRHLTLHPAAKIVALMPERVDGWLDTPQGYGIYDLADEGIVFEGAFVPPEYTSIALPFVGRAFAQVMAEYRHLAMFGLLVSDEPNGRVRVAPGGRPVMTYWIGRRDLEKIRRGLQLLARVFFAAGARRIFLPLAGRETWDDLDGALGALAEPVDPWGVELTAFHPLGTARMAARRRDGVIDPELQCWELPGLYVVDGSIFPGSLGVNPQLSIMAWATRAAADVALRLGK